MGAALSFGRAVYAQPFARGGAAGLCRGGLRFSVGLSILADLEEETVLSGISEIFSERRKAGKHAQGRAVDGEVGSAEVHDGLVFAPALGRSLHHGERTDGPVETVDHDLIDV
jgi:hypothetical protein